MPIDTTCDQCDATYRLSRALAGKLVRCANCGFSIRVPDVSPINTLAALARGAPAAAPPPPPKKPAARAAIVRRIPDEPVATPQPAPAPVETAPLKAAAAKAAPPPPPPAPPAARPADPDDEDEILIEIEDAPAPRKAAPPEPEPEPEPVSSQRPSAGKIARSAPARPAPPPEPEVDSYDLSALAAAERTAEPLEERVYIPPVIERAPRPSLFSRLFQDSGPKPARRRQPGAAARHDLSVDTLFIQSPMWYAQILAIVACLVAQTQSPILLLLTAAYVGILLIITVFTAFFKFIMGCSPTVSFLAIPGFAFPLFLAFAFYCGNSNQPELYQQALQYHAIGIVECGLISTLVAVGYTLCTDARSLVRAFIALFYVGLDYVLAYYIAHAAALFALHAQQQQFQQPRF